MDKFLNKKVLLAVGGLVAAAVVAKKLTGSTEVTATEA